MRSSMHKRYAAKVAHGARRVEEHFLLDCNRIIAINAER